MTDKPMDCYLAFDEPYFIFSNRPRWTVIFICLIIMYTQKFSHLAEKYLWLCKFDV